MTMFLMALVVYCAWVIFGFVYFISRLGDKNNVTLLDKIIIMPILPIAWTIGFIGLLFL